MATSGGLPEHILNPNPEIYRSDNYVVLDYETTNLLKGSALEPRNRIVLSVWGSNANYNSSLSGEYDLSKLVADVKAADFLVAHNAKFELQWLERCGLDLSEVVVWDTMIAEYVIGGNRYRPNQLSLDYVSNRRYGEGKGNLVSKLIKCGVCPSKIPSSWLLKYCERDVTLTERLFQSQLADMNSTRLLPVVYTRCLLTPVLADMETNGMTLCGTEVVELHEEKEQEYADTQIALEKLTGGINTNSPKQIAEYVYSTLGFAELKDYKGQVIKTATGTPKTDAETIKKLKATTKKQRDFLALYVQSKDVNNQLTKYLRKFHECISEANGLLRAQFNQCRTQTHRLSSSGLDFACQFQNFPRLYKRLFKASIRGWCIGEADGAQLEFRVAAHLGRCSAALGSIQRGEDVHALSASVIGVSRQEAKKHTFKPLYGGTSGTAKQRKYYKVFRDKYPGITGTQQRWVDTVLGTKRLETEYGLVYYWPDTRMERSGYITNTASICNYPVQGFATAEIIPIAVVYFWHRIKAEGLSMRLLNTIHDSIIAEFPEGESDDFKRLCSQCLIDDVYNYLANVYNIRLTVPLGAGVKIGEHWGEGEEVKYEADEKLWNT